MKYLKMLGLAAVAAAALMAFAGSASATTLTSPANTALPANTTIHADLATGVAKLTNSFGVPIECSKSTVEGKTTNAGGAGVTISGHIENLTFETCNCEVKVLKNGSLEIHATGNGNGTLTGSNQEVTTVCTTALGKIHCIWSTGAGTTLGTVTGGSPAVLNANATITRTGGTSGAACGSTGTWTAHYKVTNPNPLFIS